MHTIFGDEFIPSKEVEKKWNSRRTDESRENAVSKAIVISLSIYRNGKNSVLYLYGLMLYELSLKDIRKSTQSNNSSNEEREKKVATETYFSIRFGSVWLGTILRLMKTNEWIFILFVYGGARRTLIEHSILRCYRAYSVRRHFSIYLNTSREMCAF